MRRTAPDDEAVLPLTHARALRLQAGCLADNLALPYEKIFRWRHTRLAAYFETAGWSEEALAPDDSPSTPTHADAEVDPALQELLASASLAHLAEAVRGLPLAHCLSLAVRDRLGLLRTLGERGVARLRERQELANALARAARAQGILEASHAVAPAVSSAPPLVVSASCGLCNRLRAVLSYLARAQEEGRPLVVVWQPDEACPGEFSEGFERLPATQFVPSFAALRGLRVHHYANDYHPAVKFTFGETTCFQPLRPNQSVRDAVARNVLALQPGFVAVHIRRTDHTFTGQTTDDDFVRFAEAHAPQHVFVATDNAETQQHMAARLGSRVRVDLLSKMNRSTRLLRQTSLHASVVDLLTCAAADVFKGSYYSSFSDTVYHLRKLHEFSDPQDEHEITSASTRASLQHDAFRETETQLKVALPRDVEATRVSTSPQAVPRHIYQTNKSANVSKKTLDNVRHMLSINPEWSYHFYDDARCELFFEEHAATTLAFAGDVMSAWRRLKAGAAKADFWRYCVMYTYGGLYLDLDSGINRPLDDLLTASDQGLWQFDEDANLIQWVLIHVPRDVVLGKVIALSTERVLAGEPNIYLATGPHLLNDAYLRHHTGFKVYDANSGMSKERRLEICVRSGARHEDRDTFAMAYAHYAATDIYSCRSERYTPGWNRRTPGLYWEYK